MLIVETIGRIRREHFVQGKTAGLNGRPDTTALAQSIRDLKLSRNTVRNVLRSAETAFSYGREVQPRPKLGRWVEDLVRLLARNAIRPGCATPTSSARASGALHARPDGRGRA